MACKPSRIKTGGRAFFVLTGGFIMEQNQRFLLEKPVFPLLVSMAVPVMLSMLINSLYNVVDSIWVSRLGTDAITSLSSSEYHHGSWSGLGRRCQLLNFHESWSRKQEQGRSSGICRPLSGPDTLSVIYCSGHFYYKTISWDVYR